MVQKENEANEESLVVKKKTSRPKAFARMLNVTENVFSAG